MPAPALAVQEEPEQPKTTVPVEHRLALTLEECAALTGFKVCALRSAIHAGDLPFVRSGERGRYLIRRESLEQFLREREQRQ